MNALSQPGFDKAFQEVQVVFVVGPEDFTATGRLQPERQAKIPVKTIPYGDGLLFPILGIATRSTKQSSRGKATFIRVVSWHYPGTAIAVGTVNKKLVAEIVDGLPGIFESVSHMSNY